MTSFSLYIKSIITAGICAFLCETVCTHFSKNKLSTKAIKFITNLCIFTIAVSPVFSLVAGINLKNLDFSQENSSEYSENTFINLTTNEMEKTLILQILQNTGITAQQISIDIEYENEVINVKRIQAQVNNNDDIQKVHDYLASIFPKETKIEITVNNNE